MFSLQLMAILLEENALESLHKSLKHKQSNIVVSESYVELAPLTILDGQNCVHFVGLHVICHFFSLEILVLLTLEVAEASDC